jgi:hypothetical protein
LPKVTIPQVAASETPEKPVKVTNEVLTGVQRVAYVPDKCSAKGKAIGYSRMISFGKSGRFNKKGLHPEDTKGKEIAIAIGNASNGPNGRAYARIDQKERCWMARNDVWANTPFADVAFYPGTQEEFNAEYPLER